MDIDESSFEGSESHHNSSLSSSTSLGSLGYSIQSSAFLQISDYSSFSRFRRAPNAHFQWFYIHTFPNTYK